MDTLYTRLGVEATATAEEITAAYKKLIRSVHPDLASSDADRVDREEKAKLVNEAYNTLKTPEGRKEYDADLYIKSHTPHPSSYASYTTPGTTHHVPKPEAEPEQGTSFADAQAAAQERYWAHSPEETERPEPRRYTTRAKTTSEVRDEERARADARRAAEKEKRATLPLGRVTWPLLLLFLAGGVFTGTLSFLVHALPVVHAAIRDWKFNWPWHMAPHTAPLTLVSWAAFAGAGMLLSLLFLWKWRYDVRYEEGARRLLWPVVLTLLLVVVGDILGIFLLQWGLILLALAVVVGIVLALL